MTDKPEDPKPRQLAIYKAIANVIANTHPIGKDMKAPSEVGGYAYRGIEQMIGELRPAFVKYGIVCIPNVTRMERAEVESSRGKSMQLTVLNVQHRFVALEDGSSVICETIGEAMDRGDKSCNKAMSAAFKYALMEVFMLGGEDTEASEDAERGGTSKASPSTASRSQDPDAIINDNQWRKLLYEAGERAKAIGDESITHMDIVKDIGNRLGFSSSKDITRGAMDNFLRQIEQWEPGSAPQEPEDF